MYSRRKFMLSGGAALLAASCHRRKASGYSGFAFVANQEGQAIAAIDLAAFAVARHIPLDANPAGVVAHPSKPVAYAFTRESGAVYEIDAERLAIARKLPLGAPVLSVVISRHGGKLYALCGAPGRVAVISTASMRVVAMYPVPGEPSQLAVSPDERSLAVSHASGAALTLIGAGERRAPTTFGTAGEIRSLCYRGDSQCLIAADVSRRMLSLYDVPGGKPIVDLPLAVRPDHLCFNSDGGQLFVTGDGLDAVVVIYPYHTPQIGETVLAGHSPGAMAASASPGYLFIAGPQSSDVSILDIDTRKVIAVTPVGSNPSFIAVTPDSSYALVLNQTSGDMAVIRTESIARAVAQSPRSRRGALFMMIPVGSKPVSAAVVPI
jgi:YVTN family beta-propeller protein